MTPERLTAIRERMLEYLGECSVAGLGMCPCWGKSGVGRMQRWIVETVTLVWDGMGKGNV